MRCGHGLANAGRVKLHLDDGGCEWGKAGGLKRYIPGAHTGCETFGVLDDSLRDDGLYDVVHSSSVLATMAVIRVTRQSNASTVQALEDMRQVLS